MVYENFERVCENHYRPEASMIERYIAKKSIEFVRIYDLKRERG